MRGDLRLFSPLILRLFDFAARGVAGQVPGQLQLASMLGLVRFAAGIEGELGFV